MKKKSVLCKVLGNVVLVGALTALLSTTALAENGATEVLQGRRVFIHSSGVAFWGWDNYLCSGLTDESNDIYDAIIESTLPDDLNYVAVDESYAYLSTSDALYRVNLNDFNSGSAAMEEVYDWQLIHGFDVYEGYAYFMTGDDLTRVPVTGGDAVDVAEGIYDCAVTPDGIYYTDENGGLYLGDFDGSSRKHLTDTPKNCSIAVEGDFVYCKGSEETYLQCYSLTDDTMIQLTTEHPLRNHSSFWVNNTYLLYYSEDLDVYRVDLATRSETELHSLYSLPSSDSGWFQNNMLYNVLGDTLYISDIEHDLDLRQTLSETITDQPDQESSAASGGSDSSGSTTSGGYDILQDLSIHASEGTAFMDTAYFSLSLPGSISWDYEQIDNSAFLIYYSPARDAGCGGTVVSIRAYDWGDNSYEDFPEWQIAGSSNDKKYVAILPTDVQYDVNDATQVEEYQRLLNCAYRMNDQSESGDNPFYVYFD